MHAVRCASAVALAALSAVCVVAKTSKDHCVDWEETGMALNGNPATCAQLAPHCEEQSMVRACHVKKRHAHLAVV